jgi:predicted DNA-binding transcriptional regulator AlpA
LLGEKKELEKNLVYVLYPQQFLHHGVRIHLSPGTEAAALSSINRSMLWRMPKDGQLPRVGLGSAMRRIRVPDVQHLMGEGCQ